MKSKEFENFINKTSKFMERALNTEDIMGSFFEESDKDLQKQINSMKGDKITNLFSFMDD